MPSIGYEVKVFAATGATQGFRDNDFCHAIVGELVRLPGATCCNPRCGCAWSMAGLASSKATTTFVVTDRTDLDATTYGELFVDALSREGWIGRKGGMTGEDARELARAHLELASSFDAGAILEIRGDEIHLRPVKVS